MDKILQVIDLSFEIGGRSKAFIELGFNLVCAIANNKECASVFSDLIGNDKIIYEELKNISPKELPNADIITGKITTQSFSVTNKKIIEQSDIKNSIYNIIENRLPKMFLLEAPPIILTKYRGEEFKLILESYEKIGYNIIYQIFEESKYSGYPIIGKQLYIVGIRKDFEFEEFYFSEPKNANYKLDLYKEQDSNVNEWYRRVNKIENVQYEVG